MELEFAKRFKVAVQLP